ncbi:RidA family protein [Caulobacter soli]|uniref:RidA family protein n=1 Tax=Caulobacter soli TaxID=2708539 RepID=UPI0013EAF500|nr:RidA family protein [Caulobacter soli]
MTRRTTLAAALVSSLGLIGGHAAAHAADIKRAPSAGPIAISPAVTAPPGSTLVFLSGALPTIADRAAPGTTETQTRSVLDKLEATLKAENLTLADVVKATVFLVGDPAKGGEIDFSGLNAAWTQRFGTTEQPNKPARSTVKVAGLVAPGALVEIEVVAARAP